MMKKAFFVLLSLVLPLALIQPAFATGRIWVNNKTSYSVKVDIGVSFFAVTSRPASAGRSKAIGSSKLSNTKNKALFISCLSL
jgi:hypothetical protein